MKSKIPSKYEIEASDLLAAMKIEFRAVFIFHGPFWPDDKESRNVWEMILTRPAVDRKDVKTFSVRFGQSINDSFRDQFELNRASWGPKRRGDMIPTQRNVPTSYDLLTCITKNDPGTFANFCGEMGLDTDSRKAEKTYFAVQEEWEKVRAFFSSEEIEKIQEIN
jgi:hypothetical protein